MSIVDSYQFDSFAACLAQRIGKQTEAHIHIKIDGQTDRKIDRATDRQTDRQFNSFLILRT